MQTVSDPAQLFGYEVIDSEGSKIGSVDSVWVDDATSELEFIAAKTGWLMGKNHVIPTADAQIGDGTITVPYAASQVKDAPSFSGDEELSPEQEDEIYSFYGTERSTAASPTGLPPGGSNLASTDTETDRTTDTTGTAAQDDRAGMTLSEEQLQVGTRQVEAGRVRLRKVVRTERTEVPVELRREEVEIERVPASGTSTDVPSDAFQEGEIEIPVMREEAVVAKEARVTGGVRLNKDVTTETETVGGEVRKEDVEIDNDLDTTSNRQTREY